jgi:DNA-binding winged helix-turn-helix (wHTH) protein
MSSQLNAPRVVRFGLFELDLSAGELRKQDHKIKLQDQPFQVLVLLLRRPGEVATREELQLALWPKDTFVEFDQGLNTAIKKIRLALGDSADNPRFIETLPRKGYRFIAPVDLTAAEVSAAQAQPTPVDGAALTAAAVRPVKRRSTAAIAWVLFGLALAALGVRLRWHRTPSSARSNWVQVTNFPDGATSPALSSDGRMITFIRGPETFVTPGQIYVKLLPDAKAGRAYA